MGSFAAANRSTELARRSADGLQDEVSSVLGQVGGAVIVGKSEHATGASAVNGELRFSGHEVCKPRSLNFSIVLFWNTFM